METNIDDVDEELDMDEILDGLYLGGLEPTKDFDYLKLKKVTHILTIHTDPLSASHNEKFKCKFICLLDMPESDLLSEFEDCFCFIDEGMRDGVVFVHCVAGASRSATIVTAYIMQKFNIGVEQALSQVKQRRPFACPNSGFIEQLKLFEDIGCRVNKDNDLYKKYRLQKLALLMQNSSGDAGGSIPLELLNENPTNVSSDEEIYKCKKCRKPLFKKHGVIAHDEGDGEAAFDWRSDLPHSSERESKPCQQSLFVEPVQWMAPAIMVPEGKLACWKCGSKIGSFVWHGERCPCGTWIAPAFHIQNSKVDRCAPKVAITNYESQCCFKFN